MLQHGVLAETWCTLLQHAIAVSQIETLHALLGDQLESLIVSVRHMLLLQV
jgi:hypothetical protein